MEWIRIWSNSEPILSTNGGIPTPFRRRLKAYSGLGLFRDLGGIPSDEAANLLLLEAFGNHQIGGIPEEALTVYRAHSELKMLLTQRRYIWSTDEYMDIGERTWLGILELWSGLVGASPVDLGPLVLRRASDEEREFEWAGPGTPGPGPVYFGNTVPMIWLMSVYRELSGSSRSFLSCVYDDEAAVVVPESTGLAELMMERGINLSSRFGDAITGP